MTWRPPQRSFAKIIARIVIGRMAASAEKSYVWMGFRILLPLTQIGIVKDILLAGNMPAAHHKNKPLSSFVIHGLLTF